LGLTVPNQWRRGKTSVLLKLYIYGYLNRVQSSRRLEREADRNLEVMWLTGRLAPDHKTIADFRKDNGPAIKKVCAQFVELCRKMGLLAKASVAIDGSKFKAVNSRDNNFTKGKLERRLKQIEESVDLLNLRPHHRPRKLATNPAPFYTAWTQSGLAARNDDAAQQSKRGGAHAHRAHSSPLKFSQMLLRLRMPFHELAQA
jgi:Transposase domain (DUF772)